MRPVHYMLALLVVVLWGVNFIFIDFGLRGLAAAAPRRRSLHPRGVPGDLLREVPTRGLPPHPAHRGVHVRGPVRSALHIDVPRSPGRSDLDRHPDPGGIHRPRRRARTARVPESASDHRHPHRPLRAGRHRAEPAGLGPDRSLPRRPRRLPVVGDRQCHRPRCEGRDQRRADDRVVGTCRAGSAVRALASRRWPRRGGPCPGAPDLGCRGLDRLHRRVRISHRLCHLGLACLPASRHRRSHRSRCSSRWSVCSLPGSSSATVPQCPSSSGVCSCSSASRSRPECSRPLRAASRDRSSDHGRSSPAKSPRPNIRRPRADSRSHT